MTTNLHGSSWTGGTIKPGTPVQFEVVETRTGPTARNIQQFKEPTL